MKTLFILLALFSLNANAAEISLHCYHKVHDDLNKQGLVLTKILRIYDYESQYASHPLIAIDGYLRKMKEIDVFPVTIFLNDGSDSCPINIIQLL
jgi:hypothetical protein